MDPGAGALVNSVAADGPGAKAQLHPGDIVATVEREDGARRARAHSRAARARRWAERCSLEVIRAREALRDQGRARRAPRAGDRTGSSGAAETHRSRRGSVSRCAISTAEQSVQLGLPPRSLAAIAQVAPGSAADRAGLRTGDIVIEADGVVEPTAAQVTQAGGDGHMLLRVRRRDAAFYAAVRR